MRKLIFIFFILLFFFPFPVIQSVAFGQLFFTSTHMKGRLSGHVIDLRGDPVASVVIVFSDENNSIKAIAGIAHYFAGLRYVS